MPSVSVDLVIAAPAGAVWIQVKDTESYPQFMENVRSVTILDQSEATRRTSRWSTLLKGSVLEWTELEAIDDANLRIEFHQLDGDLDLFEGHWQLTETAPSETHVELAVVFEIGIPLLADMLNPVAARALKGNSEAMLHEIEARLATT
jgi:ribosome-associated toxin RatA of RatAB toxin-antitoxin module